VHLVGSIIRIYYDARSSECQIQMSKEELWFESQLREGILFFFCKASNRAWGPQSILFKGYRGLFFWK